MPSDFTLPGVIRAELKPAVKGLRTRLENASNLKAPIAARGRLRWWAGYLNRLMRDLEDLETEARAAARASEARQEREGR